MRVRCRRYESSRSLSHLLMSFLYIVPEQQFRIIVCIFVYFMFYLLTILCNLLILLLVCMPLCCLNIYLSFDTVKVSHSQIKKERTKERSSRGNLPPDQKTTRQHTEGISYIKMTSNHTNANGNILFIRT